MTFLLSKLSSLAIGMARTATAIGIAYAKGKKIKKRMKEALNVNKEDVVIMKKSTLVAIIAVLAAVIGALAAVCVYLRRRESELDEYENLLFSEDFSHEEFDDDDDELFPLTEDLAESAAAEEKAEEPAEEDDEDVEA